MPAAPYSTPGGYKSGAWLIARQDGSQANIVDRAHLPPTGRGFQYYWLGSTFQQASARLSDAMAKLGVNADQANATQDLTTLLQNALKGQPTNPRGRTQPIGQDPLQAPGTDLKNTFGGISDAITSGLDFMKFVAWIFHPQNILRAVEFLSGVALMVFGFHAAMQGRGERIEGFSTSEGVLTRSGLGRVATELGRATRSRERPSRPRSAPHRTRQRALSQRYRREEDLQRRRSSNPRPKRSP